MNVHQGLRKFFNLAELSRFELAAAALGNTWTMVFLAHWSDPAHPWPTAMMNLGLAGALGLTCMVAIGLIVATLALNDVLDARHDHTFAPGRPIPSGQVQPRVAITVAMGSVIAAVAGAIPLGAPSTVVTLLAAAGIVFYNMMGRFVPAVGLVSMGLLTALGMLIPHPGTVWVWPIMLAMTHVMACGTLRYWLAGKRPRLSGRHGWGILAGWSFWTLALVGLATARGQAIPDHARWMWIGPALAIGVFAGVSVGVLHGKMGPQRHRRRAAIRFGQLSAAWLLVYDAAWLGSAGLIWQAGIIAGLLAAAIVLNRVGQWFRATPGEQMPRIGLAWPADTGKARARRGRTPT